MASGIPQVQDTVLIGDDIDGINVGSSTWFAWLDGATIFAFSCSQGHFTARKEQGARGGAYWKAYRTQAGKLRRVYLGKSGNLVLERLHDVAARLAEQDATITSRDKGSGTLDMPHPAMSTSASPLVQTKLYVPRTLMERSSPALSWV